MAKAFAKTGDTAFSLGRLALHNEAGLFVPVSLLNELRRRLYAAVEPEHKEGSLPPLSSQRERGTPKWIVKTDNAATLAEIDLSQVAEVVFMLSPQTTDADLQGLPKHKLRLALPAVCRQTKAFEKVIAHFGSRAIAGGKLRIIGELRRCRGRAPTSVLTGRFMC